MKWRIPGRFPPEWIIGAICKKAPPDTLNATSETASVAVHDGSVAEGHIPSHVLRQVQEFVKINRDVLTDYWEERIDTRQLDRRVRPIASR